jgi:hypothetical protein
MRHDIRSEHLTADFPPGTVVFLIGMRINRWRSVLTWWPVFIAMPRMLRELFTHPELGMLDARTEVGWRRATVIQYWSSMDALLAYATAADHAHLPAWRHYNRRTRSAADVVGIWHEAYIVDPAQSHVLYRNMPTFGMGKATSLLSATTPSRSREYPSPSNDK